jgi:two-component system, cell cycle sensor histidine kinase and response regulator CckA
MKSDAFWSAKTLMDLSSQIDTVYQRALRLQQRAIESSVDPGILEASLTELRFVLEELQTSQEELHLQNQVLIASQQTVERERQRYRTLYELAPDGYLVTDRQGNIRQANRAAASLFSMPQEWLIDKPLAVLIHEPDRSHFLTRLAHLEPLQDWEILLKSRNGARRSVAVSMTHLVEAEGETKGMLLWLLRDITPRKQAEAKIREQAALIDISPDAIMMRDLDCHILFWNKGAEQIYGWTAAEILGRSSCELLFKKFSPQLETAIQNVRAKGEWRGEFQKVTKSGQEIRVDSRWKLLRNETGQPHAILTVETDITEQKQLESQFLRAQRLESLGILASGIAHDMNNILAPMLASAQLLPVLNPTLDKQSQELLTIFEESSRRGAELVKQILAFVRGIEGDRMTVQVKHILAEFLQIIQSTFPKSIEIVSTFPKEDLWLVSANATQLHQVFLNCCINARDAMPNGGTLSISAENRVIDETYVRMNLDAKVGPYVVVTFADTGTGIAPEHLDRIFEPFFTTKNVGKGTGLGLSTGAGIAKNHGGFMSVSSKIGQGAQFQVFLPAAEAAETASEETHELFQGQGELILVADDEANIQETLKRTLESRNYQVLLAADGIEAIAAYAMHQDRIKVVLIDLMMPSMDGSTAIRTLQQFNPQLKIIACSGSPASDSLLETLEVEAFLPKPFTAEALLRTLHCILT